MLAVVGQETHVWHQPGARSLDHVALHWVVDNAVGKLRRSNDYMEFVACPQQACGD